MDCSGGQYDVIVSSGECDIDRGALPHTHSTIYSAIHYVILYFDIWKSK